VVLLLPSDRMIRVRRISIDLQEGMIFAEHVRVKDGGLLSPPERMFHVLPINSRERGLRAEPGRYGS
jgi:hypothetical protein